jgi:hypothetical protein
MVARMSTDDLHRMLKAQAAERGMTLSDYLCEIEEIADLPTLAELMERLARDEPVELDEPPEVTCGRSAGRGDRGRRVGPAPAARRACHAVQRGATRPRDRRRAGAPRLRPPQSCPWRSRAAGGVLRPHPER